MAKYAGEALQGQLATAAATSASGGDLMGHTGPSPQLLQTIQDLVDQAVARRQLQDAAPEAESLPHPIEVAFHSASSFPGAPSLPPARQVRAAKAGQDSGIVHDAVVCDQAIPADGWVTRCSWHFGRRPHVLMDNAVVTCARCLSRRLVETR